MAETSAPAPTTEVTRYESLPKPLKIICLVLWGVGIGFFIWYMWAWTPGGWCLEGPMFFYILYLTFSTTVFLVLPMRKQHRTRIPWYDVALAALLFGICIYYVLNAHSIAREVWIPAQSTVAFVLPLITIFLALESGRRMAGLPFTIIVLIVGTYPLYAEHLPGLLWGFSVDIQHLAAEFAFGAQGMLGLPAQTTGEILIGFLIFAGILIASGAGRFFLNLALALMGRFRGGPAKVAVLSSGFFGSLSGSTIANIVATGSVTIPAMKKIGYPSHYAGAIEAVASSGGVIMPPVMGVVAFLLSILAGIPYSFIMIAAFIPAILYYWGLLVQVDSYAARVGLKGLPREELPSLLKTLKQGWPFIAVIIFLVFGLLYMRWGMKAPVYASGLMLLLSFTSRETMMTPKRLVAALATIGGLITYIMAVLFPVALLLIGVQLPGTLTALTAQMVILGAENLLIILLIAVVVCFLLGMVGMAIIPYIVIAVTAIPAMASATGLSLLGIHLFVIYYLLTGPLTPPVCVAAFTASALAASPPMKTGFTAMRLAVVLYFIPWFFVFNPALVMEGPLSETLILFALCLVGIWILASGLEGYLLRVGRLELWARPLLFVGGFLIAFPGYQILTSNPFLTWWMTSIIGGIVTAVVIVIMLMRKKMTAAKLPTGGEST